MVNEEGDRLHGKVVLVTGASRGVGARVAVLLGARGASVAVNYRNKQRRADEVVAEVEEAGGQAFAVQCDVTDDGERRQMFEQVAAHFGRIDVLVLNASGGLEHNMPADYAMRLNRDAQMALAEGALPLMVDGGRVVFVTSHMAHFHGTMTSYDVYEPVAVSKKAGEDALRGRVHELAARGVSLVVVSGDLIDGTTTPQLMQRLEPGLIETRRQQAGGWLPTMDDFGRAIVEAAFDAGLESGATVYVGSVE